MAHDADPWRALLLVVADVAVLTGAVLWLRRAAAKEQRPRRRRRTRQLPLSSGANPKQ